MQEEIKVPINLLTVMAAGAVLTALTGTGLPMGLATIYASWKRL